MACEELLKNLDNMLDAYDAAMQAETQAQMDLHAAQFATMGAMGGAMMAYWMLQECLNGQTGLQRLSEAAEVFQSPEKLKASISEMKAFREKRKQKHD
jgi:predicted alpha/beta-fold hydrolase